MGPPLAGAVTGWAPRSLKRRNDWWAQLNVFVVGELPAHTLLRTNSNGTFSSHNAMLMVCVRFRGAATLWVAGALQGLAVLAGSAFRK
jgi:hypothetical protein